MLLLYHEILYLITQRGNLKWLKNGSVWGNLLLMTLTTKTRNI
nr:MAG TPA: hypothetical protein [Caudoviricetes sp.]